MVHCKLLFITIISTVSLTAYSQVPVIKPSKILDAPIMSYEDYMRAENDMAFNDSLRQASIDLESSAVFWDLYSPACSWYCGGVISSVTASSCLAPHGKINYEAENAHDFNHESAWAEGVNGDGIGEYLVYEFPGNCPRVTAVKILNGHEKSEKTWRANNRVKRLKIYYNNEEYAILELEDTRCLQRFEIGIVGNGPMATDADPWTLKFEILDVYKGDRYDDTVISELYFDGTDVH